MLGTYEITLVPNKGGRDDEPGRIEWSTLRLSDGTRVWVSRKPDPETAKKLTGKRVEIVGQIQPSPCGGPQCFTGDLAMSAIESETPIDP